MLQTGDRKIGNQRDWVWRGWQTRYTYLRWSGGGKSSLPPVLLLHGFGASIGHWQHNLEFLAIDHTVYGLDLVGWGGSRKPDIKYNIDLWVDQVYDFWQTFVGQPMILVGNSIGSLVALVAAARHPEMAASLVMVSLPDLSAEQEMIPRQFQPLVNGLKKVILNPPLLHTLFRFVSQPKVARKWAQIAYANPERVTDDLIDLFLTPAREREAPAAFVKIMQGMTSSDFSPNIRKLLPNIQIPMLLLWGCEDRMIPPGTADILLKLNPRLELVNLEAAGHCAHDEVPDLVNDTIRNWLDLLAGIASPPELEVEVGSDLNAQMLDFPYPLSPTQR
ncbi:alpha/beta fold hydrolase [Chamaesiphon sp. VAR_48_metabat_135_sub]|uniref:alpha/beta fold hydrolase n=1 Tax=Chamaesiphon sp. VAR_48_metabat_135_sub TaxID=2964699 RepID=UPI00286D46C5|nr:alpha/beta fold hydrolase [Chamaesiphon sp. VAR_48_metabat_135_sub]